MQCGGVSDVATLRTRNRSQSKQRRRIVSGWVYGFVFGKGGGMRSEVVKGLVQSLERLRGGQGIKGAHLPTFYYSNGRLMKTSLLAVLFGALTITAVSAQPAPSARPRP